jgi:hypothetical protein
MTIYEVWSLTVPEEGDALKALETRRTDKGAAYDDANLIRGILHRKARVVEVEAS